LGVIEWSKKGFNQAEEYFELATRYDPNYFPSVFNLSLLWLECGRTRDATSMYRAAIRLSSNTLEDKELLYRLGRALQRVGHLPGEVIEAPDADLSMIQTKKDKLRALLKETKKKIATEARKTKDNNTADEVAQQEQQTTSSPTKVAYRRKCTRVLIVSTAIKSHDIIVDAALDEIGVVVFNPETTTLKQLVAMVSEKARGIHGKQY
jgi:tetratricopeptide (TPR) repeat protein